LTTQHQLTEIALAVNGTTRRLVPPSAAGFGSGPAGPAAQGPVGTVDKFQGQTCAAVIYSMATSSPSDAARGMEFLHSLNRLNVATSRDCPQRRQ